MTGRVSIDAIFSLDMPVARAFARAAEVEAAWAEREARETADAEAARLAAQTAEREAERAYIEANGARNAAAGRLVAALRAMGRDAGPLGSDGSVRVYIDGSLLILTTPPDRLKDILANIEPDGRAYVHSDWPAEFFDRVTAEVESPRFDSARETVADHLRPEAQAKANFDAKVAARRASVYTAFGLTPVPT